MSENQVRCEGCRKETTHRHVHDTAYGIEGTHMAGSERYECTVCGRAMRKEESLEKGLNFILD